MTDSIWRGTELAAVVCLAVLLGASVGRDPQAGFALALAVVGLMTLAAQSAVLVVGALVAALTFKGLVTLGALPSIATFADIPLAWTALGSALLRRSAGARGAGDGSHRSSVARALQLLLAALGVAVFVGWLFNPSEALRPFLYFGLIGEPFAIVVALLIDPPAPRLRRAMLRIAAILALIQVPLAFVQAARLGIGDSVQGTLYGAGAGAHVMAAVVVVGACWVVAQQAYSFALRLPLAVAMLAVPILSDAKQVTFALPAILLVTRWRQWSEALRNVSVVLVPIVVLVTVIPAGAVAVRFLQRAESGRGGKREAARLVWDAAKGDPATVAFGKGPAETVSRAAFMTTNLLLHQGSPIQSLGLQPAQEAIDVQEGALAFSGGGTSANSGISSALGVFGDAGLVGIAVYLALLSTLLIALRRAASSPERTAAAAGWAMFAVLGLVFDWWEQPPFGLFIAVLAGLALVPRLEAATALRRKGV